MNRILFKVSYDGTNYGGFQRQISKNTIQDKIEYAITRMTRLNLTIQSAGRTDKGVHAIEQTFHLDTNLDIKLDKWITGLNLRLPSDIIIIDAKVVSNSFHARHSAKSREYYYYVAKRPSTIFTQRFEVYVEDFDLSLANKAKDKFIGTKDFRAFSKYNKEKDPVRTINHITIKETDDHYIFVFNGVSFLRYMVRSIMGIIIDVASNKRELEDIDLIFETNDRTLASKTALAKGLFLNKIVY